MFRVKSRARTCVRVYLCVYVLLSACASMLARTSWATHFFASQAILMHEWRWSPFYHSVHVWVGVCVFMWVYVRVGRLIVISFHAGAYASREYKIQRTTNQGEHPSQDAQWDQI